MVQLPQGCMKTVTLGDTAYVLLFQTNTILYKWFKKAGGYWDTQSCPQMLMYKTTLYTITEMLYRQYMVEHNQLEESTDVTLFATQSAGP